MVGDGARGDAEGEPDLAMRASEEEQLQHLPLPRGEPGLAHRALAPCAEQRVDVPRRRLRVAILGADAEQGAHPGAEQDAVHRLREEVVGAGGEAADYL